MALGLLPVSQVCRLEMHGCARLTGCTLPLSTLGERTFSGRRGQAPETALQASRVGNEALTWWSLRHTLRLCRIRGGEMWHGGELRPGPTGILGRLLWLGWGWGWGELPTVNSGSPHSPNQLSVFELARWGLSTDMYENQLSWRNHYYYQTPLPTRSAHGCCC